MEFKIEDIEKKDFKDLKLIKINNNFIFLSIYDKLKISKSLIDNHYENWDNVKKYINPYELINSNRNKYLTVSRSFFKLWEMIIQFNLINNKNSIFIANIAEAPGGFIECILKYRGNQDIIFSNSLYSKDNNIPSWNKIKKLIQTNNYKNVNLIYTNLYNHLNVNNYIKLFQDNKAEFITADGGFDYSVDFNKQEEMSYKIIFSEIFITLSIQKIGGNFVLKIFDMFTIFTLKCIYLLYNLYDEVYLYKPLTSRIANSEKYLICKNYKGIDNDLLINIKNIYLNLDENNYKIDIENLKFPNSFLVKINDFMTLFYNNQIDIINNTIEDIKKNKKINTKELYIEQEKKANEWYRKYKFI
jgi:23S rRNA U2552 (ribose-2'-O)-methylase RlmE/FtsJ